MAGTHAQKLRSRDTIKHELVRAAHTWSPLSGTAWGCSLIIARFVVNLCVRGLIIRPSELVRLWGGRRDLIAVEAINTCAKNGASRQPWHGQWPRIFNALGSWVIRICSNVWYLATWQGPTTGESISPTIAR
jgi:hypothetical protein